MRPIIFYAIVALSVPALSAQFATTKSAHESLHETVVAYNRETFVGQWIAISSDSRTTAFIELTPDGHGAIRWLLHDNLSSWGSIRNWTLDMPSEAIRGEIELPGRDEYAAFSASAEVGMIKGFRTAPRTYVNTLEGLTFIKIERVNRRIETVRDLKP